MVILLTVNAAAQPIWSRFLSSISGRCVSFPYEMTGRSSKHPAELVSVCGTVKFQGRCYILTFGESKMYCDGKTEWLLDEDSKELQITDAFDEDVDNINEGSLMNPASIVGHLDRYFLEKSVSSVTENGKALVRVEFVPKHQSGSVFAISSLTIWFKDGSPRPVIVRGLFQCANGTRYDFTIPSMTVSAPAPPQTFWFDEKSLGPGWVVSDMR